MKNKIIITLFLLVFGFTFSQEKNNHKEKRQARENLREGNELYHQLKFKEAEVAYKKALSKNPNYPKAIYNLGNAIYQQNRGKEAVEQFNLANKTYKKEEQKAEIYHNTGNAFMKEKQYQQAVEFYKNALRNNSKDEETRYNLALAKKLLKNQQQNKKNKDQKNKEDKENKKEENKNKKDKNNNKEKNKDQKTPRPVKLNPQQMQQLLEAMNNEENKTLKKLNERKIKVKKIKREKDW